MIFQYRLYIVSVQQGRLNEMTDTFYKVISMSKQIIFTSVTRKIWYAIFLFCIRSYIFLFFNSRQNFILIHQIKRFTTLPNKNVQKNAMNFVLALVHSLAIRVLRMNQIICSRIKLIPLKIFTKE